VGVVPRPPRKVKGGKKFTAPLIKFYYFLVFFFSYLKHCDERCFPHPPPPPHPQIFDHHMVWLEGLFELSNGFDVPVQWGVRGMWRKTFSVSLTFLLEEVAMSTLHFSRFIPCVICSFLITYCPSDRKLKKPSCFFALSLRITKHCKRVAWSLAGWQVYDGNAIWTHNNRLIQTAALTSVTLRYHPVYGVEMSGRPPGQDSPWSLKWNPCHAPVTPLTSK